MGDSQNKDTVLETRNRHTKMKYSIEVETNSRVYESPCSSGFGTPANGRGTPSRQLNWAIEVDILTGEPLQVTMDDADIGRVNADKLAKKMSAVKRISRVEKDEELIQKSFSPWGLCYLHRQAGRAHHPEWHPADSGAQGQAGLSRSREAGGAWLLICRPTRVIG